MTTTENWNGTASKKSFALFNGVHVFHFALMPNHLHLLVRPDGEVFSECIKLLQNRFTNRFCKKYSFRGHLWQGRFKAKRIDNDAYLFACGTYIEMNPVRAQLVDDPAKWPSNSMTFAFKIYLYSSTLARMTG